VNNVALYNTCLYFIQTENSEFVHRLHMQSRQHFLLFGSRLLARVLKEGVQFWYNNTSSTVKRGEGFEKTFLWKTFEVHVSSCQYLRSPGGTINKKQTFLREKTQKGKNTNFFRKKHKLFLKKKHKLFLKKKHKLFLGQTRGRTRVQLIVQDGRREYCCE
jgi:hypothetical protein